MISTSAARALFRSSSVRSAAARAGSSRPALFRAAANLRRPAAAPRFLRSPVEVCFCVESLLPMHSVTASALMTSMLAVSRRGYGWLSDAGNDDV